MHCSVLAIQGSIAESNFADILITQSCQDSNAETTVAETTALKPPF